MISLFFICYHDTWSLRHFWPWRSGVEQMLKSSRRWSPTRPNGWSSSQPLREQPKLPLGSEENMFFQYLESTFVGIGCKPSWVSKVQKMIPPYYTHQIIEVLSRDKGCLHKVSTHQYVLLKSKEEVAWVGEAKTQLQAQQPTHAF